MKQLFVIFIIFVLIAQSAIARKYYINASLPSLCPITIYANNKLYILEEANEYATSGNGVVIIETLGDSRLDFSAYSKDNLKITQYTENSKKDSKGNIEYIRIILGGTGTTWSESNNSDNDYLTEDMDIPFTTNTNEEYSEPLNKQYQTNNNQNIKENVVEKVTELGFSAINSLGNAATDRMNENAEGYPNILIAAGLSRAYGEFVRFKWYLGGAGGYVLYGGLGKDWIFNGVNKKHLSWHLAIGYFLVLNGDTNQDITVGVCYAETPVLAGGTLNLDLTYSYFFGNVKRFGVFGGGAFGVGNVKGVFKEQKTNEKFLGKPVWDLHLGFAIKLWKSEK